MSPKVVMSIGLVTVAISGACPHAAAGTYNARGLYINVSAAYNSVTNGFDGKNYFNSGDELMLVPKLDPSTGWSAAFGWRWSANSVEISYSRSIHDYSFSDTTLNTASYNLVNLSFKHFYRCERRLQPYFNVDFGVPGWFGVNQGSFSTATGLVNGSVSYTGLVLGGGGGLSLQASPRLAVSAGAVARMFWITDLNTGAGENWQVTGLSAFSPAAMVGITYVF